MPGGDQERVCISGRDDGVAVGEADAETAKGDDFGEREIGGFGVEVPFHDLQVWSQGAEVVVCFLVGQVA